MERDWKDTIKEIATIGNYTLLEYWKGGRLEWNVALNYDREAQEWDSGNYCYSFESALAKLLSKINSKAVKSVTQTTVENGYGITYERMMEIASKLKDKIIEDGEEIGEDDFFEVELEMTEDERIFFDLKKKKYEIHDVVISKKVYATLRIAVPEGEDVEDYIDFYDTYIDWESEDSHEVEEDRSVTDGLTADQVRDHYECQNEDTFED